MSTSLRMLVIDPQGPSVYERELTADQVHELCGGPIEVIGLRAVSDDAPTLELCVGDPKLYHSEHVFELDGQRYVGTGVVMARDANLAPVNADVSVKWVERRVRFP